MHAFSCCFWSGSLGGASRRPGMGPHEEGEEGEEGTVERVESSPPSSN